MRSRLIARALLLSVGCSLAQEVPDQPGASGEPDDPDGEIPRAPFDQRLLEDYVMRDVRMLAGTRSGAEARASCVIGWRQVAHFVQREDSLELRLSWASWDPSCGSSSAASWPTPDSVFAGVVQLSAAGSAAPEDYVVSIPAFVGASGRCRVEGVSGRIRRAINDDGNPTEDFQLDLSSDQLDCSFFPSDLVGARQFLLQATVTPDY